jgi:hypothetical protein
VHDAVEAVETLLAQPAASVDRCPASVTSSSTTAASCGSRLAIRWHSDSARPKLDRTTVAPCSWAIRAVA